MLRRGSRVPDNSRSLKIHLSTAYRIKKIFETIGDVKTSKRSGRSRSVVTKKIKAAIKGNVKRNPKRSIRKIASELKTSDRSKSYEINEYENCGSC